MTEKDKFFSFKALIYSVGINRCVDVPEKVSKALGNEKYIPVKGKINDLSFESTLTPRGKNKHRLFIHSSIWRKLSVDNGDKVSVSFKPARPPADLKVPDDVKESLLRNKKALAVFEGLTARSRNSYIEYINQAKHPDTRRKRIKLGIQRLLERGEKKEKLKK